MYRMYDLIQKKKSKIELSTDEINFMIDGFTKGDIPSEQMSAFAMAVYFNGMTSQETSALTIAMANSGDRVDLSLLDGFKVDKHSTGGVGDKTTFIITSIVASLGIKVAKMSGRGLGHTGGTSDKIEAIPGVKIAFEASEFLDIVQKTDACLAGQSGDLAPADKKLYALRDVTATVDSLPLIAASVMSKKIASGSDGIVLDVKTGNGAFMNNLDDSLKLAETMVDIGKNSGLKIAALITDMNIPTGYAIGNTLEIIEVLDVLRGSGPEDLVNICIELAANMIQLATDKPIEECRQLSLTQLQNGDAFSKFIDIIAAQGGDIRYLNNPSLFATSEHQVEIFAPSSGFVKSMNAQNCGNSASILGAGRLKITDSIDHSAGIVLAAKTGDYVEKGALIATFHTNNLNSIEAAKSLFLTDFEIADDAPVASPLIYSRLTAGGLERFTK